MLSGSTAIKWSSPWDSIGWLALTLHERRHTLSLCLGGLRGGLPCVQKGIRAGIPLAQRFFSACFSHKFAAEQPLEACSAQMQSLSSLGASQNCLLQRALPVGEGVWPASTTLSTQASELTKACHLAGLHGYSLKKEVKLRIFEEDGQGFDTYLEPI